MVVLDPHGPVRSEAVFNAPADQPPTIGVGCVDGKYVADRRHFRHPPAIVDPAAASLATEQRVVCRIAEACRNRRNPIRLCAAWEGSGSEHGVRWHLYGSAANAPDEAITKSAATLDPQISFIAPVLRFCLFKGVCDLCSSVSGNSRFRDR
jgi:hypothetical protein